MHKPFFSASVGEELFAASHLTARRLAAGLCPTVMLVNRSLLPEESQCWETLLVSWPIGHTALVFDCSLVSNAYFNYGAFQGVIFKKAYLLCSTHTWKVLMVIRLKLAVISPCRVCYWALLCWFPLFVLTLDIWRVHLARVHWDSLTGYKNIELLLYR